MKKHLKKIIIGAVIIVILALCYLWSGNSLSLRGTDADKGSSVAENPVVEISDTALPNNLPENGQESKKATAENKPISQGSTHMSAEEKTEVAAKIAESSASPKETIAYAEKSGAELNTDTVEEYITEPVSEEKPIPIKSQGEGITDEKHTCTLSVRCDTILSRMAWLDSEKVELVPKDGVIFASAQVDFYEGESVFNLLKREMKKNAIHMEFVNTPLYNSAYIEGIANIYEFDCGELSGWMYRVNGWFPNYGCSRYELKPGDNVELVYTCDLGNDVGAHFTTGKGQRDE